MTTTLAAFESTAPAAFEWDDRYLVGHRGIDETHEEFAQLVNAMLDADAQSLRDALDAFARHAEAHFALEERLMEQHAFPARGCHADEHERVLASVREVQALVAGGDVEAGRDLAQALADWFPGHSDYMDSALAIWICKKTANAAPLVLRRFKQPPGRVAGAGA
jgi:hemerythrin